MRLPGAIFPVRALRRAAHRLAPMVSEVPAEFEACMGDCRATDCCRARWENCELRRRQLTARLAYEARERQRRAAI